ncbi:DUF6745 domain-containing protein [uncultured Bradyrhizobium sp.]|uniref:DUF6745 domain-containing protein n=1 Tax=uncultured Bradyrhizobium sp. TaxID=199684 RepID=UPI0035CC15F4
MAKIIRTKTKAHGGITAREKSLMDEHAQLWISRAMRTDPIEPEKIIPEIEGLYAVAGLKKPRVVIVPSPLVMAFAYGASAAIWYARKHPNARNATRIATRNATDNATDIATLNATDNATRIATRNATDNAEENAASACRDLAGDLGIASARRWHESYQGGNMWASYDCYLTACRGILGLELTSHAAYAYWEQAAIHGGFRVLHEEFCIVSDFPEVLLKDEENRPHCEAGPSHRWRDGWSLYHWHGTKVPAEWIEDRASLTPKIALSQQNMELRRAACEILGWANILRDLNASTIDCDGDPQIGELVEVKLPDLPAKAKFLRVRCGTGREFAIGIPPHINKALDAQAWIVGLEPRDFVRPEIRA